MSYSGGERLERTLRELVPSSPKRVPDRHREWFDYYAGYADGFVGDVVSAIAGQTSTLLDPWNGAGTTTATAARSGLRGIGVDLNPAAVVIAKARLLTSDVASSLVPLAEDVIGHARVADSDSSSDLLARWLYPATVSHLIRLRRAIDQIMIPPEEPGADTQSARAQHMSSLPALFYLALFRATRELLTPFMASNPTWIRLRVDPHDRVRASFNRIARRFHVHVEQLAEAARTSNAYALPRRPSEVYVGSSTKLPFRRSSIGAVLTSPPYCTRIDYAVATLPELGVMGYDWAYVQRLRGELIGTPTMLDADHVLSEVGSARLARFLKQVSRHQSYAATTYYHRFYAQYFHGMWRSLGEISRVTRFGAPIVLVVQDSWFKDIQVATPAILTEMGASLGWTVTGEHRFGVKTRATMHPHRANFPTSRATETVTIYSR